jgi:hypothetical protein
MAAVGECVGLGTGEGAPSDDRRRWPRLDRESLSRFTDHAFYFFQLARSETVRDCA